MANASVRPHLAAALAYAAADGLFLDHGVPITQNILGIGADPSLIMWFLAWWPWAILHHAYPLYTHLIWQPGGLNLAWTTCVPLLALLAAPVTLLCGPVVSFNLLTLSAPLLAALAAYALCLYLTRQPAPAFLGGYLFGFSTYEMAQSTGHLNLDFTVFIPLLVLVALARLDGGLARKPAVALAVFLLAAQFCTSLEIFASGALFGAIAWALAYGCEPERRAALRGLAVDALWAAPWLAALLSPFLWAMFGLHHEIALPSFWSTMFATDALNLVLPTATTWLGAAFAQPVAGHFTGYLEEQGGYFGVPLLIILWFFSRAGGRFLPALLGVIILLSLGPVLWLGGVQTGIPLPWALLRHLPFMGAALPARFMLYAWLAAALCAARWAAAAPAGPARRMRLAAGALAALFILPAWHRTQPLPAVRFFAPGQEAAALGANRKILILPFGISGPSSYWQAESKFSFAQTGGYLGFPPASVQTDQPLMRFYFGLDTPGFGADFTRYCQRTGTDYVVVAPGTTPAALAAITALHWPMRPVDDVLVFTVPHA